MICDRINELIYEQLQELLDEPAERELRTHLDGCEGCRLEAAETRRLWNEMGRAEVEVPSDRMRARFYVALGAYQEAARREHSPSARLRRWLAALWPQQPALQFGIAAAMLLIGLVVGGQFGFGGGARGEIQELRQEMATMNRTVALSLMEHGSASERLRGVEWSRDAVSDSRVLDTLLEAVRHDPNVNVRLAALETLTAVAGQPRVGRTLLDVLQRENSPFMQVALAETALTGGVEGSAEAVETLLQREELDPNVRQRLSAAIESQI